MRKITDKLGFVTELYQAEHSMAVCCHCGKPINKSDLYTICSNCGGYFCENCVTDGSFTKHICDDDECEVP